MSEEFHAEEEHLGKVADWPVIRRLLGYLRPYRGRVIFSVVLILLHSALQASIPMFFKVAVDTYFQPPGSPEAGGFLWLGNLLPADPLAGLHLLTAFFGLFLLAGLVVSYGQTYIMMMTGQYVMYDLRMKIFRHLQKLEIAYFDRTRWGGWSPA